MEEFHRNGHYTDAVTGNAITVGGGTISFHVRANSAGIYVLNSPGKIGIDGVYLADDCPKSEKRAVLFGVNSTAESRS